MTPELFQPRLFVCEARGYVRRFKSIPRPSPVRDGEHRALPQLIVCVASVDQATQQMFISSLFSSVHRASYLCLFMINTLSFFLLRLSTTRVSDAAIKHDHAALSTTPMKFLLETLGADPLALRERRESKR